MKVEKYLICLLLMLCPFIFLGQIKISETIQESSLAQQDENALYFVDFWATWCVPCIHVSKYLESLQYQYPNNFYILSLSQESPKLVKRFIKKHKINLAVAIDYQGETFHNNSIQTLPYGILYNAKGKKIWQGHPAELKAVHIEKFLRANKKTIAINEMFKSQSKKQEINLKTIAPKEDFEYTRIPKEISALQVIKEEYHLEIKGTLQEILAYSFNVFRDQVDVPRDLNKTYKMSFKLNTNAYYNMSQTILNALKLNRLDAEEEGVALVFDTKNIKLWDKRQIDWGTDSQPFLIGEADIQADNVSLDQVKYQLASLLKIPIVISDKTTDNNLHDWEIHYKYFDLMVSSFEDNYNIKIEKKMANYPQYIITK